MTDRKFFEQAMDSAHDWMRIRYERAGQPFRWGTCADNKFGSVHRDSLRHALRSLTPSERESFVRGWIEWQKDVPACGWRGREEQNTHEMIVYALDDQFEYPNRAPLSEITSMTPERLAERVTELLAA